MVTIQDFQRAIGLKTAFLGVSSKKEGSDLMVEGYMVIYNNIDNDGDVILPGAFTEYIQRFEQGVKEKVDFLPLLYRHRWDMKVGRVTKMVEDHKGVWIQAVIDASTDAGKLVEGMLSQKENSLKGFSYFFYDGIGRMREGVRYIERADLAEATLTPSPANEFALIKNIKTSKELYKVWKKYIQGVLHNDGGLSSSESRILFAQGMKGLGVEDDLVKIMTKILDGLPHR